MVKGVSSEFLCRSCKTLYSRFLLMALNLTSWKRPTAISRVLLSSNSETFVDSNVIFNNTIN